MTAALRIDQGVELPPARRAKRDAVTLALDTMQVGESFAMPIDINNPGSRVSTANMRLKPKKFTARKRGGEFRVWRIA